MCVSKRTSACILLSIRLMVCAYALIYSLNFLNDGNVQNCAIETERASERANNNAIDRGGGGREGGAEQERESRIVYQS